MSVIERILEMINEKSKPAARGNDGEKEEKLFFRDKYWGQAHFKIPYGYTRICDRGLERCNRLQTVEVPASVITIGSRAFAECRNLKQVILNEGIKMIDTNVFTDCPSLKSVTIPDSVAYMNGWAFYKCGLEEAVYNRSKTILYCYPASIKEETAVIPEGVEKIVRQAFLESSFTTLILPSSLKKLEKYAFHKCKNLKKVQLLCDPDAICPGALAGCSADIVKKDGSSFRRMEILKFKGDSLVRAYRTKLPDTSYVKTEEFRLLAERCGKNDMDAMVEMAEYFSNKYAESSENFYKRAENFWKYFAYVRGNKTVEKWVEDWAESHPDEYLPSVLPVPVCNAPGGLLNAVGFLFFDPEKFYGIDGPDEDGVVEVKSYADEDGPDEDGFGREVYYDWWYLTDCLAEVPGAEMLRSYSNLDKRNAEEKFKEIHDKVALEIKKKRG